MDDVQNWKIPSEIYAKLDVAKNMDMILYRISRNLSQSRAAQIAKVSPATWMGMENKKIIPTQDEATKVALTIGKSVYKLFPVTRHDTVRLLPIRGLAKLALIRCVRGIAQVDLAKKANVPLKILRSLERVWIDVTDISEEEIVYVQMVADFLGEDIVNIIGKATLIK
jgi:DNA-binding XRE family transcriptional regulator